MTLNHLYLRGLRFRALTIIVRVMIRRILPVIREGDDGSGPERVRVEV